MPSENKTPKVIDDVYQSVILEKRRKKRQILLKKIGQRSAMAEKNIENIEKLVQLTS